MRHKVLLLTVPFYLAIAVLVFRYYGTEAPVGPPPPGSGTEVLREELPLPKVTFRNVAAQSGVDFVHDTGNYGEILFPEINGPGCGFLDFDNDGDQDLFLVDSGKWPHKVPDPENPTVTHSLYRNDGRGNFVNVGEQMGLHCRSYGQGVCFGDYDNDGYEDVYLVCAGPNVLFRNDGGRRFVDVTGQCGVECPEWSSVAAFVDYDRDGFLDLFVGNYVEWSVEIERKVLAEAEADVREDDIREGRMSLESDENRRRVEELREQGRLTSADEYSYAPNLYEPTHCTLYRNLGTGKFRDVTSESGILRDQRGGKPAARAMGVAISDMDDDGWPDIAVANDEGPEFLFRNLGDGTFQDVALEVGLATRSSARFSDSMGMQWADYKNNGVLCLGMGRYAMQGIALHVPVGKEHVVYFNRGREEGLGALPRPYTNWGQFFFDYDLDGRQDFFVACGHVSRGRALYHGQPYRQSSGLFWNSGSSPTFRLAGPEDVGPDLCENLVGRGAAYGDIDADGDLDILLTTNGGPARLFRNEADFEKHYVRLKLVGTKSNRSAIGAKVRLRSGGIWQRREVLSGSSYASQSELVLTFGLGRLDRAEKVIVWWPSGVTQTLTEVPANRTVVVTEPGGPEAGISR